MPVFIIGNPRSGTTLLRLLLTSHSKLCIPPECGWIIGLSMLFDKKFLYSQHAEDYDDGFYYSVEDLIENLFLPSTKKFETWNLSPELLHKDLTSWVEETGPKQYHEVIDHIYRVYGEQHGQKNTLRWGDKNNFYLNHITYLAKLFPYAQFVHIVRDGRDVACSYKDMVAYRNLRYGPQLPTDTLDIAHRWSSNLSTIEKSFSSLYYKRYQIIKYEDLVTNTVLELSKLCTFLGLKFEDSMLEFYAKNLEPEATLHWKVKTEEPVDNTRIERYKQELSSNEIKLFENVAEPYLIKYGYKV